MKYRTRIYYTDAQKALMWERWRQGGRCTRLLNCSIAPMARFEASLSGPVAFEHRDAAAPRLR
jgi:hypothetical protein